MASTIKSTISRVQNGSIVSTFQFHFNPGTINRSREAKYDFMNSPGTAGSSAEFVRTDDQTVGLKILLAATRKGNLTTSQRLVTRAKGIRPELAEMESWTLPAFEDFLVDETNYIQPPTLIFSFGERSWEVVCLQCSIREFQFDSNLNPTLAEVNLRLKTKSTSIRGLKSQIQALYQDRELLQNFDIPDAIGGELG